MLSRKATIATFAAASAISTFAQPLPNEYYVNDLLRQFSGLNAHAEPIGFNRGVGADASLCKHYQGMVRISDTNGLPIFIMSRSGNATASCATESDTAGELLVVEFDSRDNDGERMRSNRLRRDARFEDTTPPSTDRGTKSIRLNGTSTDSNGRVWPAWCHPGGMQAVDDVLFVPVEHRFSPNDPDAGGFLIVDLSDPDDPTLIKEIVMPFKIGVMAVQRDPQTHLYQFLMTGGDFDSGDQLLFYRSNGTDPRAASFNLDPLSLMSWNRDDDPDQVDRDSWREWQTINFVRNDDGSLHIIGLDDDNFAGIGTGKAGLFRVNVGPGGDIDLDFRAGRNLGQTEPTVGDLDATGGVYVSPSGQLLLYAGEHDNDGPDGSVRMGEYRYRDVNYPTDAGCGGTITLYENHAGWGDHSSQSYTFDYTDRSLENWEDLSNFEDRAGDLNGFTDEAESVTWLIAPGRYGMLYENDNYDGRSMILIGDGQPHGLADLGELDDEISSLRMLTLPSTLYVATDIDDPFCPGRGVGTPDCPIHGGNAISYAASILGAPPCFMLGTLSIEAGTYVEPLVLTRPMVLEARNGEVEIRF